MSSDVKQLAQFYVKIINDKRYSRLPEEFLPPEDWHEDDGCSWVPDAWYLPWRKKKKLSFYKWCRIHDWAYRKNGYWEHRRSRETQKLVDMIWKYGMKSEGSWLLYCIYWRGVRHLGKRAWQT